MAEKWELGGTIIEKDGETLVELNGIRIVDKKPVRAVVYHSVADLERFLYDFIKKREEEITARIKEEGSQQLAFPMQSLRPGEVFFSSNCPNSSRSLKTC